MTLAANLLNAVGGSPRLDQPGFIARYPCTLPHSNRAFQVPLAPFCPETVRTLMRVELPQADGAPPQDDGYETIAQFYRAIEAGLIGLADRLGEAALFSGDPARQVGPDDMAYLGGGRAIVVRDLDSALAALAEILHQGEGLQGSAVWDGDRDMFHPERPEVAHYFRLRQLLDGRRFRPGDTPDAGPTGEPIAVDWDGVHRPASNPDPAHYAPGSEAHRLLVAFERDYCEALRLLERGFNGEPGCIGRSVGAMVGLREQAEELMRLPGCEPGRSVGLSFGYHPADEAPDAAAAPHIEVLPHGPYVVRGHLPLHRRGIVRSERGEALGWRDDGAFEVRADYVLCRCGASRNKPFCDGSHARVGFDGTETADSGASAQRRKVYAGAGMTLFDDRPLCIHAGFCTNRDTDAWQLVARTADVQVRTQLVGMIEHCPSGALGWAPEPASAGGPDAAGTGQPEATEPHLCPAIGVVTDGPLWVTGGVEVRRADGAVLERRNRVTLCRCGRSQQKPLCDGSHAAVGEEGW